MLLTKGNVTIENGRLVVDTYNMTDEEINMIVEFVDMPVQVKILALDYVNGLVRAIKR